MSKSHIPQYPLIVWPSLVHTMHAYSQKPPSSQGWRKISEFVVGNRVPVDITTLTSLGGQPPLPQDAAGVSVAADADGSHVGHVALHFFLAAFAPRLRPGKSGAGMLVPRAWPACARPHAALSSTAGAASSLWSETGMSATAAGRNSDPAGGAQSRQRGGRLQGPGQHPRRRGGSCAADARAAEGPASASAGDCDGAWRTGLLAPAE